MSPRSRRLPLSAIVALLLGTPFAQAADAPAIGPWFEPQQPFFQSQVQLVAPPRGQEVGGNFVVRGIVLPLASGHAVVFDQELMRLAGLWKIPADGTPTTPVTMAQFSYPSPRRKVAAEHPQPTGPLLLSVGMHPGIGPDVASLANDPRQPRSPFGDEGRGALPVSQARFEGIQYAGGTAVLHYKSGNTLFKEWHEGREDAGETLVLRHLEVAPHAAAIKLSVGAAGGGATWALNGDRSATAEAATIGRIRIATNSPALTLAQEQGEIVATLAPSTEIQRVTLAVILGAAGSASTDTNDASRVGPTPALPSKLANLRWPGTATAPATLGVIQQNGLILDRIATPDENPWKRRVRVCDLAFFNDDRAAVVCYDGDVWLVEGLADQKLGKLTWRRFTSGLYEPMAIAIVNGTIQVATKNGVVRVYDRDGNGEADWLENFNDQMIQSQTTRSFPLDMAVGPDGWTYISQGGIVTRSGLVSGGEGTSQTGAILRISPDGRTSEVFASGAREPFFTINPKTGVVTATDQQGHFIPSSLTYYVRKGDNFGYMQENPEKLTLPLVWIPHDQDISSSSQVWMMGAGMGPYDGRLLHLSYGTGRLFLIAGDFNAPKPQGAVIPLDIKTDLPLLHGRMQPRGDSVFVAGFQIWGTRTTTDWALGRIRRGDTPITTAIDARSVAEGVILNFAEPLDPASLLPEKVTVRAWNYKRSKAYGSGRYALGGEDGTTPWGVAQVVLSQDKKSVFIHMPKLPTAAQVEVRHDFKLARGDAARGAVFFTIYENREADLMAMGFPKVDMTKTAAVVVKEKEEPATAALGKTVSETLGCVACHSADGTTEGKIGPTWRRLFGSKRTFVDGTSEIADEAYIRDKIIDPQQKKMKAGQVEMPSYRGVLSETQIDSVILYIKTLTGGGRQPAPGKDG